MNAIQKFETLIAMVESIEPSDLDMRNWGACGTAMCVCGHASMLSAFNKQGFSYDYEDWVPMHYDGNTWKYNWSAVERFFELSQVQSGHLFGAASYMVTDKPIKEQVLNRLRKHLARLRVAQ
jgi:hypothetical protein